MIFILHELEGISLKFRFQFVTSGKGKDPLNISIL